MLPRRAVSRVLSLALIPLLAWGDPAAGANCAGTSTGRIPLTDLGSGTYQGYTGGLYPGGSNVRPPAHDEAGIAIGQSIDRLDTSGVPGPGGRIVLLSIGMSNCFLEFRTFMEWVDGDPAFNHAVQLINGAQGGQVAELIADPAAAYWNYVDGQLAANGASPAQVQVVWLKNTNRNPTLGFPAQTQELAQQLGTIVRNLKARFPNLKQIFVSSRSYGGYASIPLSPEPYAYESAFAFQWLIGDQIAGVDSLNFDPAAGPVEAPWIAWGPYLWADGLVPRSDGLTWSCGQFDALDGIHPNPAGQNVVAAALRAFFLSDPATPWFRAGPSAVDESARPSTAMARPIPARSHVVLRFSAPDPGRAVDVFDLAGRRVRTLPGDGTEFRWDLRDARGVRVPDGVYWARRAGGAAGLRIVVSK